MRTYDVVIIGAGPAGCVSAGILKRAGKSVLMLEKSVFPRFMIGESFLPQNMIYFSEAGLDEAFKENFQPKNGATFLWRDKFSTIDFCHKSAFGPSTTYQVERDRFDKALTDILISQGVDIIFSANVVSAEREQGLFEIGYERNGESHSAKGQFLIDASGFARVLPKILNQDVIQYKENRQSFFTHIKTDHKCSFDNEKILIVIDQLNSATWFWAIPLGNNKYSIGVTTSINDEAAIHRNNDEAFNFFLKRNPFFYKMLGKYDHLFEVKNIKNYSSSIKKSFGDQYVIIGNSCEFIDPIFSSGVTIGVKSASLAANLIVKQLDGDEVDWEMSYVKKLMSGVSVFHIFIDYWYQGKLQEIFYSSKTNEKIKSMIVSILAGYVWDEKNIFTSRTLERLKAISGYSD